ncbi:MAG: uracil phosphoribosyltransferase [Candidatus Pacebacteria bacterium]|nr:uracil phosphoribosyltransferase [Candidatus Paceibacterota bacterium]
MNEINGIIGRIARKQLPLVEWEMKLVKDFCSSQIEAGKLVVLPGGIPDILRKDWLDETLDLDVRANQHINVKPKEWWLAMVAQCAKTVKYYLREQSIKKDILALIMWRAALLFVFPLCAYDVKMMHMQARRNEKTLKITTPMPLNDADTKLLGCGGYSYIIPDPMLASGASFAYSIQFLREKGIPESRITILCVVAAPEGVFRLLQQFPEIKIIAAVLDDHLNSDAYILPGVGDAGAKTVVGNSIKNFQIIRTIFTEAQWEWLNYLIEAANTEESSMRIWFRWELSLGLINKITNAVKGYRCVFCPDNHTVEILHPKGKGEKDKVFWKFRANFGLLDDEDFEVT